MRFLAGLALILVIVFGLLSLVEIEALQDSLVAATSGPVSDFLGFLGTFWLLIVGGLVVVVFLGVLVGLLRMLHR